MNKKKQAVILFCIMWFFLGITAAAMQTEDGSRTIRVGCPAQKGLTYKTEDGEYTGYTIDYLEELSKYTEWNYEFVEVEGDMNTQIMTLMDMLEKGDIDILGAMNYTDELGERFYYPSYDYGTSYTALAVSKGSVRWMEEDYDNWDGIRVASYPAMEKRMEALEDFAKINGFTYEVVECADKEEMFQAVYDKRADALLQVDISIASGFRSIARFNPQHFYFAVSKKKPELFRNLNQGLYSLLQAYPGLQSHLYEKYFSHNGDFYLTEENKQYIKGLGTLNVLFFKGNRPVQDEKKGEEQGVAGSFFKKLHDDIGLEYVPVFADSYEHGRKLMEDGAVDIVAAVPPDSFSPGEIKLHFSHPYFESYGIIVDNEEIAEDGEPNGQWLSSNVEQELWDMERQSDGKRLMDANCVSFYTRKKGLYDSLYFDWGSTMNLRYSLGLVNDREERLLGIINNYIGNLTEDAMQEMLYENACDPAEYTFSEALYVHKGKLFILLIFILFIFALCRVYIKIKELKGKALENERFYQFSRLTNECLFVYDYKKDQLNVQNSQEFFPGESLIGHYLEKHRVPGEHEYRRKLKTALNDMLVKKEEQREILSQRHGMDYWYRIQIRYIGDKGEYAIGRISDVNQDILRQNALKKRADSDELTGIHNRASVERFVSDYLQNEQNTGIMVLLDIDNFKMVNDTLGHLAGDQVLKQFAAMLKRSFRHTDIKARLGGDEFVIFLTNYIEEEQLGDKLENLIDDLKENVFRSYPSCNLSVSIGAAYTGTDAKDYQGLYRLADYAMYVAKFGGKNDYFIAENEVCMKHGCDNCRPVCRRRDYLLQRGALQRDKNAPEKIILADLCRDAGKRSLQQECRTAG